MQGRDRRGRRSDILSSAVLTQGLRPLPPTTAAGRQTAGPSTSAVLQLAWPRFRKYLSGWWKASVALDCPRPSEPSPDLAPPGRPPAASPCPRPAPLSHVTCPLQMPPQLPTPTPDAPGLSSPAAANACAQNTSPAGPAAQALTVQREGPALAQLLGVTREAPGCPASQECICSLGALGHLGPQ